MVDHRADRAQRAGRAFPGALLAAVAALAAACAPAVREPASAQVISIAVPAPAAEVTAMDAGPDEPQEPPRAQHGKVIQGIADIYIGQPADEVRRLLGPEDDVVTPDAERTSWTSSGYDPEEGAVFLLGFDKILVYNDPKAGQTVPFWKIYTRAERVMFIILTSYGFEAMSLEKVGFPPSCYLLGNDRGITATFGNRPILVKDAEHGHDTYHYLDQGISVIASEGQTRVFDIFGALTAAERSRLDRALSAAARRKATTKKP